jgi:cell division cycle 14
MSSKLTDKSLAGRRIVYFSGQQMPRRANSIYLLAAYSMLYLGKTPEEAVRPFQGMSPFVAPWHDASPTIDTFHLTTLDVLRGIAKARACGFFSLDHFDLGEYETYEKVENGDMNWLVDGRFLAFAGPHDTRSAVATGYHTTAVDDLVPYFRAKGITAVVRLNKKYYNERRFTTTGIAHYDMYYLDGSNPPEHILQRFLHTCESTAGEERQVGRFVSS